MSPDNSPADPDLLQQEIAGAISTVLARHERSMVGRWVALIETIDVDGRVGLWSFTSDGLTAWDTVGLLGHAMHLQQAQTLRQPEA